MSKFTRNPAAADHIRMAADIAVAIPEILLPRPGTDLYRWAVVACDQYTSQPDYWQEVEEIVGTAPSARRLVLPEIYLEHPGSLSVERRITRINDIMGQYLAEETLLDVGPGWIAIDRETGHHASRKGLLLAIDLDQYDYEPGNRKMIRATEGTVLDRIPPRLAIRRDAPLELPHIQLLIDDPEKTVIEPLLDACITGTPLYDTPLMLGGGRVRGWHVPAASHLVRRALEAMATLESLRDHGLLFAVGDGNHSLATAKAHWEKIRGQVPAGHPARFALVEVINVHDAGLDFEPIHRVVFDISPEKFFSEAESFFAGQDLAVTEGPLGQPDYSAQIIPLFWQDKVWTIAIGKPACSLAAGSLQAFLDSLALEGGCRIDYIHGEDVVRKLAGQGHLGLLLPAIDKFSFFETIARDGVLPRKTFSMGEADEKRYYIECRRIR